MKVHWTVGLTIAAFLALVSTSSPTATSATALQTEETTTGTCVCPVYPWAFHETYWSYYAIECPSTAVNLDAEPNLLFTGCGSCGMQGTYCIPISEKSTSAYKQAKTSKTGMNKHRVQKQQIRKPKGPGIAKTGFHQRHDHPHDPVVVPGVATKIPESEKYCEVPVTGGGHHRTCQAKLVQYIVDLSKLPKDVKDKLKAQFGNAIFTPVTFYVGFEVTSRPESVPKTDPDDTVRVDNCCYRVRIGSDWYQVITNPPKP